MLTDLKEISLDGFQIVKGECFTHLPRKSDPTCTINPTSISFSMQAVRSLNTCENIQIRVNAKTKCLLVLPISAKDRDSVRWIKCVQEPQARKIECSRFTSQLYESWGLDNALRYRANGKLVTADGKVYLYFNFNEAEVWGQPKGEKHE